MNFGSFSGGIFQVPMSDLPTKIDTKSKINKLAYNATGRHSGEGSYMFHRHGFYYLLYSAGTCCGYKDKMPSRGEEYQIVMCRSKSPSSGFVNMDGIDCTQSGGSTLLASHDDVYGPGGQGVTVTGSGDLLLYYHYANRTLGMGDGDYVFGYNYLKFRNGWPYVTSAHEERKESSENIRQK